MLCCALVFQAPKAFSARKISLSSKSTLQPACMLKTLAALKLCGIMAPSVLGGLNLVGCCCFSRQQGLSWHRQFRRRSGLWCCSGPQEEVGLQHCRDHQEALHQHHYRLPQGITAPKPPVLLLGPAPQTSFFPFSPVSNPGHPAVSRPGCCGGPAP